MQSRLGEEARFEPALAEGDGEHAGSQVSPASFGQLLLGSPRPRLTREPLFGVPRQSLDVRFRVSRRVERLRLVEPPEAIGEPPASAVVSSQLLELARALVVGAAV